MPDNSKTVIYTIGHSDLNFQEFLKLLNSKGIKLLVDVRSTPFSKYSPQFNMNQFKTKLKMSNIEYKFMGNDLGGKPKDAKYYENGKVNYELIRESERYKKGLIDLLNISNEKKIVIMCSEENPDICHRNILIAKDLFNKNVNFCHIRSKKATKMPKKDDIQLTLV